MNIIFASLSKLSPKMEEYELQEYERYLLNAGREIQWMTTELLKGSLRTLCNLMDKEP